MNSYELFEFYIVWVLMAAPVAFLIAQLFKK